MLVQIVSIIYECSYITTAYSSHFVTVAHVATEHVTHVESMLGKFGHFQKKYCVVLEYQVEE